MILDSNLIIDAAKPEFPGLRRLIATRSPAVSAVSLVKVLGYHKLSENDRSHFQRFFAVAQVLPISDAVIVRAILLRQSRKMSLGVAPVAATASVAGRELDTHNDKKSEGIPGLVAIDPIADGDPP